MAYDNKNLKRDGSGITPTPQHFNPTADDYEPLYGRNNASRVELYGPDGNPISTASNKLAVRVAELESLIGEVQASPTANTLLARLKNLETKIDAIIAGTSPANVKLTGSIPEYAWFSDAAIKPTPAEAFAWGNQFNKVTGELKVFGWTGTAWVEVA